MDRQGESTRDHMYDNCCRGIGHAEKERSSRSIDTNNLCLIIVRSNGSKPTILQYKLFSNGVGCCSPAKPDDVITED